MKHLVTICALFACVAASATCTTGTSGNCEVGSGKTYSTIAAAIAAPPAAGQTIQVFGNGVFYNENPTIPAGTAGNYISLIANPGDTVYLNSVTIHSHTKVNGFSIQAGAIPVAVTGVSCVSIPTGTTDAYITNNHMHECGPNSGGSMISSPTSTTGSSFIVIDGNTLSYGCSLSSAPNVCEGLILNGDHYLMQNNDLSHLSDGVSLFANFSVWRNNNVHDFDGHDCGTHSSNCHIDEIESEPSASQGASHDNLYEKNVLLRNNNSGSNNNHEWLTQGDVCGGRCGHLIARFNIAAHVGAGAGDSGGQGLLDDLAGYGSDKLYNNTEAFIGAFNVGCNSNNDYDFDSTNTNGASFNNIFYFGVFTNACSPTYQMAPYLVGASATTGFRSGCNMAFDPNSSLTLFGKITTDGSQKNVDPLFTNVGSDVYTLQSGSPARNAGCAIATVSGSINSSTSLVVNDAGVFQDGSGLTAYGVQGDCISVTTAGNHVCITAVNYSTNTLTLASPITATNGDSVWLYSISDGTRVLTGTAPDMGALPFTAAIIPSLNMSGSATMSGSTVMK